MNELRWREPGEKVSEPKSVPQFATASDHAECRKLHRKFGTTYFFASRRLPAQLRRRVHALYGFVRVPDEWVDNPRKMSPPEREQKLNEYRNELIRGMDGVSPTVPVLRAFCDVAREVSMPLDEPLTFLDAMEQDLYTTRYETYEDLREYMRGSAASVGLMMCHLLEVPMDDMIQSAAISLAEAMQLTNFLRDVGEDIRRGRIYLPMADMNRFLGSEDGILREEVTRTFVRLMKYEIERARGLYSEADLGIPLLPKDVQPAVKLARILYSRILDRVEERNYDVFNGRARTSATEKITTALLVMSGSI